MNMIIASRFEATDTVMPSRHLKGFASARVDAVDFTMVSNGFTPMSITLSKDDAIALMEWLSEVTA